MIFLSLFLVNTVFSQEFPSVITDFGKIKGHYKISSQGNQYEAYEGIPYALPPTEDRRFEPPHLISPWQGELVADKFRQLCIGHTRELNSKGNYIDGIEDCLYLNIYAPKTKGKQLLPVIFWIYGGAFQYGTIHGEEPKFLIDHDILFVSFNYRHGSLGFLSTEDEVVPGNMGLKDQAMALRWVSENIKSFGGDPKKIMLAGLSAGGASVHYHYLSPMSTGLFRSGISFSGTAFDSWTQARYSREKALEMGKLMNCPIENVREMIECLKKIPAHVLVSAQAEFMPWHLNEFTPFGPVVEKSSENAFIAKSPIEIIRNNDAYDVPWITGVVSEEGLYPVGEFATNKVALEELNKNWETIAPHLLQYYYTIPKKDHSAVARKIRQHYFDDKPINKENLLTLTHLVGDRIFVVDAEKAAREMGRANISPVWFYYYSYRATNSLSDPMSNSTENFGVSHADDVLLVLGNDMIDPTKTSRDFSMHQKSLQFWLAVARKGVPEFGPEWQQIKPDDPFLNYLHMSGPNEILEEVDDNLGEKQFWKTIHFDENQDAVNDGGNTKWKPLHYFLLLALLLVLKNC